METVKKTLIFKNEKIELEMYKDGETWVLTDGCVARIIPQLAFELGNAYMIKNDKDVVQPDKNMVKDPTSEDVHDALAEEEKKEKTLPPPPPKPKEENSSKTEWTPDKIEKMAKIKKTYKIRDNDQLNGWVAAWLGYPEKTVTWKDITPDKVDDFVKYMEEHA